MSKASVRNNNANCIGYFRIFPAQDPRGITLVMLKNEEWILWCCMKGNLVYLRVLPVAF